MSSLLGPDLMAPGPQTLSDLVPAIGRVLTGQRSAGLGLPEARRYVFLLVDGMGPVSYTHLTLPTSDLV